jgi:hypothetical protein
MQTQNHRTIVRTRIVLGKACRKLRQSISVSNLGSLDLFGSRELLGVVLTVGLVLSLAAPFARAQTASFNYAEALQKSIYFYDAEKSGPGITGGHLEWRGDSELADRRVPLVP